MLLRTSHTLPDFSMSWLTSHETNDDSPNQISEKEMVHPKISRNYTEINFPISLITTLGSKPMVDVVFGSSQVILVLGNERSHHILRHCGLDIDSKLLKAK